MSRPALEFLHDGMVLLPGGEVRRAHLALLRGKIVGVGEGEPPAVDGIGIDASPYLVMPGLVNAHDHLDFNCFPPCAPNRPYANAVEWYADVRAEANAATLRAVTALPLKHRLLAGGFKNLLSGATTAAHHNPPSRLVRGSGFPVSVPGRLGYCHSLDTEPDPAATLPRGRRRPWVIHAAEGTDRKAAGELARLEQLGCLGPGTVLVHCLGIDPDVDLLRIQAAGASVVWCPSSNEFLYRSAAPLRRLRRHAAVALGTDSTISGGGGMQAELRAARRLEPGLAPAELLEMATSAAADVLGLQRAKGRITPGAGADLVLFPLPEHPGNDPLLAPFQAAHPALVVRDGVPLAGQAGFGPLMERLGLDPLPFHLDGREYLMPRPLYRRFARTVEATRGWPPFHDLVSLG